GPNHFSSRTASSRGRSAEGGGVSTVSTSGERMPTPRAEPAAGRIDEAAGVPIVTRLRTDICGRPENGQRLELQLAPQRPVIVRIELTGGVIVLGFLERGERFV